MGTSRIIAWNSRQYATDENSGLLVSARTVTAAGSVKAGGEDGG